MRKVKQSVANLLILSLIAYLVYKYVLNDEAIRALESARLKLGESMSSAANELSLNGLKRARDQQRNEIAANQMRTREQWKKIKK